MKIVTSQYPQARLWFRYDEVPDLLHTGPQGQDPRVLRRVTAVLAPEPVVTEGLTYEASAVCAAGDRFDKKAGRKLALRRLLTQLGLSRSDRFAVWQAYFSHVRM